MAILNEVTQRTSQNVVREDLADVISRIDSRSCPLSSMIPKGKEPTNTLFEWIMDTNARPNAIAHLDGKDVDLAFTGTNGQYDETAFANMNPDRYRAGGRVQISQEVFGVSTLAENVSDVAGVGKKGEYREALKKALTSIKRGIEVTISSEQNSQQESGSSPYKTRGIFNWLVTQGQVAPAGDLPLPQNSDFRCRALDNTTAIGSFTEEKLQDQLEALYNHTGNIGNLTLLCGTTLRRTITDFSTYQSGLGTNVALRTYNQDSASKKIVQSVDIFVGDFGTVNIVPSVWLLQDPTLDPHAATPTAGNTTPAGKRAGLLLDPSLLKLRFNQLPTIKELEDRGAGRRGFVRTVYGLQVTNPSGLGCLKLAQ